MPQPIQVSSGFVIVNQVKAYLDIIERVEIAKEFVRTGISNILNNLNYYKKHGKEVNKFIVLILDELEKLRNVIEVSHLMGIEGKIIQYYYASLDIILRNGFVFEKRTRMPLKIHSIA